MIKFLLNLNKLIKMKQNYVFILLIFISKFLFNNSEITEKEIEDEFSGGDIGDLEDAMG